MSTSSVQYTFHNGTTADANQVNQNFSDIVSFLNNEVVQRDGSVLMTGPLVLSGAASSGLQAVPYSQHENGPSALRIGSATLTNTQAGLSMTSWGTEKVVITNPGRQVTVLAQLSGWLTITSGTAGLASVDVQVEISLNGGSTWHPGLPVTQGLYFGTLQAAAVSNQNVQSQVTPTGDIWVRARGQKSGSNPNVQMTNGWITVQVVPS